MSRDTIIARQSQIKTALEYCQLMGIKPSVIELLAMTDHFVQFIELGLDKEMIAKTKKLDTFVQSKLQKPNS
jgi:desulfoferrodoxin (superoxide reductase-like protein)